MVAHSLHEEGKESSLHEVGEESTEAPSAEEPALEPGSDEEASPKEPGLQVIEADYMLCEELIQSVHDKLGKLQGDVNQVAERAYQLRVKNVDLVSSLGEERQAKRQRQAEAKAELVQLLQQESDSDSGEP